MRPLSRIDRELRDLLVRELCTLMSGRTQTYAGLSLGLTQPQVSLLQRGMADGFSVSRLLRIFADQHYDVEVHLRRRARPYAQPRVPPLMTVVRYDRDAREVSRITNRVEAAREQSDERERAAVRERG